MRGHLASRFPALLLLLAACGEGGLTEPPALLDGLPRTLSAGETLLIEAANHFSFNLFRTATAELEPGENAFLSPLSASMALGMALNGAGGETAQAMRETLGYAGAGMSEINLSYHSLIELLTGLDATTEMVVANSIWSSQEFPILPTFSATVEEWFDAESSTLDFASPSAVGTINAWVGNATRGRIPKLLDQIDPAEVAFLINAIYFKGQWRKAFDRDRTSSGDFHAADGGIRRVDMMRLEPTELRHAARNGYEAVDLLYGNGAFALTVLLPSPGSTPAQVLARMDPAEWDALAAGFVEQKLGLVLPKFRLEYSRELNPDLSALGMGIAFDPARADFYGIADVRPERLYLTRVTQKTFVEVNEEGTEAAAATAVGIGITSAPTTLVVDRPFLFLIRERFSNAALFIGQINTL